MNDNNLKQIWKVGINNETKLYSESELNKMIVKSAQKSMKRIQLGGIFQFIIIAVIVYLIAILIFRNDSIEMKLFNLTGLIIIITGSVLWKHYDYKMNKYRSDIPVKEWLEYRIDELNKTIYKRKKYNLLTICLSFVLGFGFHIAHQLMTNQPFSPIVTGTIFVGLLIYFIVVVRSLNKKYIKTLEVLNELYKQFEQSN